MNEKKIDYLINKFMEKKNLSKYQQRKKRIKELENNLINLIENNINL